MNFFIKLGSRFVLFFKNFFVAQPQAKGYEVKSGPWPFYRQAIFFLLIGSINQLFRGVPSSLKEGLPSWYVYPYLTILCLGAGLVFYAIQFMDLSLKSLAVERSGTYLLLGAMIIYMGNFIYMSGFPETMQTWLLFAFITYPIQRLIQIKKEKDATLAKLRESGMT